MNNVVSLITVFYVKKRFIKIYYTFNMMIHEKYLC